MVKFGLVKGRHTLPSDSMGYVFEEITNPIDFDTIELQANRFVTRFVKRYPDETLMDIYVTVLSVALSSLSNELSIAGFTHIGLWHYDKVTDDYKCQLITI